MTSNGTKEVDLSSNSNQNISDKSNSDSTDKIRTIDIDMPLQSSSGPIASDCAATENRFGGMDSIKVDDGLSNIETHSTSALNVSKSRETMSSDNDHEISRSGATSVSKADSETKSFTSDRITDNEIMESSQVYSIVSTSQAESSNATVSAAVSSSTLPGLSKNQQKKLKKLERLKEIRAERSKYQKEQRKLRKRKEREERVERGEEELAPPTKRQLKKNTMSNSSCKIRVVLDCSFDDLMAERDIKKLVQQVQYCYSSNRRAAHPMQLYLTSLGGKTLKRLDEIGDYQGWDMYMKKGSYLEEFAKEEIVYLTSDSSNILDTLDPSKVYIIGGLVDHNHHKGHCYNEAVRHGISHAQLPIGDHIQLSSRKVLTVNHVFEILLRFTETQDWKEAFHLVIPKRKQAEADEDIEENQEQKVDRNTQGQDHEQYKEQDNEHDKEPICTL